MPKGEVYVKGAASKTKTAVLISAFGMIALIGFFDYQTRPELSVLLFYLVPVFQATWFVGKWAGIITSVLSAAVWLFARYSAVLAENGGLALYWNASIRLGIFLIVTYVISIQLALKRSLEHEKELARTDSLTRALNRRAFVQELTGEIGRSSRYSHPFSIAYIDLDNFKMINDRFGHSTGDDLLETVVEIIRENVRSSDTVARLGGDEFVVLFPETGAEEAERIAGKVTAKLAETMRSRGWPVTLSIGLATCSETSASCDAILDTAEQTMYVAKKGGKNKIEKTVLAG